MDELIRSKMHEALGVEQPAGALRSRVIGSLPVDERSLRRFGTPSFKWAPGLVAAVLAVALVAGLLYSRGYLGPHGSAVNPPKRSIPAQYGAVTMISPTTGWADWTAGHPRSTTDGGAHWTDVSPPLVLVGGFTGDYFLDATHAWVLDVLWGQQLQFVSLGTTDGGRSWQQGAVVTFDANHNYVVDASGYHGEFRPYFLDAEHGWLMIASNVTGSSSSQSVIDTLYKTIDGGLHWTLVSTNAWTYGPGTIGAQTIGCPWGMPRFISPSTGFMITVDRIGVGRCPAPLGRLALHVTHNGGVTWQIEPLAIDGSSPSCAKSCVLDPPEFVDQLHGFLVLQDPAGSRLLATSDGGISWSFRSSMPAYLTAWFETGWLDASNGWARPDIPTDPTTQSTATVPVYWTHDARATWVDVHTNLLLKAAEGGFGGLYFVDQHTGFALRSDTSGHPIDLLKTTDGGQTWTVVGPVS